MATRSRVPRPPSLGSSKHRGRAVAARRSLCPGPTAQGGSRQGLRGILQGRGQLGKVPADRHREITSFGKWGLPSRCVCVAVVLKHGTHRSGLYPKSWGKAANSETDLRF